MQKLLQTVLLLVASRASAVAPVESFLRRRLAPIDGCDVQSQCLSLSGDGLNGGESCDSDGKRTVCISWNNDGGSCVKSTSDTVSHACPVVDGVLNGDDNEKTEGWSSDSQICVTVTGGESAVFGVKDGSTCSDSGDFTIVSGDTGTCSGPLKACEGNNKKECSWTFPTSECSSSADDNTSTDDNAAGDDSVTDDSTDDNGGGGGRTCFSSSDMVQVENDGMKPFKDVKVGDSILSANRDGEFSYSKVIFLPHGENLTPTTFVVIRTEKGRIIKMTRRHLLPLCSGELAVAQDVHIGSCIRTVDGDDVVTVTREVELKGVYTAVTENEFLVVNGVIASPFASPDGTKHGLFNQTDVDAWCSSNNWLIYEHMHENPADQLAMNDKQVAPSKDCENLLGKLYTHYKDEPIGWGNNGWGYKGWKNPSSRPQPMKAH